VESETLGARDPGRTVNVKIVETIHCSRDIRLDYLEEAAGTTLAKLGGDLKWLGEMAQASPDSPAGFLEMLERHGDVQGQEWTVTWADERERNATDGL